MCHLAYTPDVKSDMLLGAGLEAHVLQGPQPIESPLVCVAHYLIDVFVLGTSGRNESMVLMELPYVGKGHLNSGSSEWGRRVFRYRYKGQARNECA